MERFELPLTAREYQPNLCYLRKAIAQQRTPMLARVTVSNEHGHSVDVFLDHATLYIVAIDFGAGPYRFDDPDLPLVPGSLPFEFGGSYNDLQLHAGPVMLSAWSLATAVKELAGHQVGARGSDFFLRRKQAVVRLIFAISEALRFWTIQRDVEAILQNPQVELAINSYAGSGQPLNSWGTWSKETNWPDRGIFVPAL